MRRFLALAIAALSLLMAAVASAGMQTVRASNATATLSWVGPLNPEIRDLRLEITDNISGAVVYDAPIKSSFCDPACIPDGKYALEFADLAGDQVLNVVLELFTGGADCCEVVQVLTPSASMGTYFVTEHNFGEAGAKVSYLGGPGLEFRSADNAFYCAFTTCAGSGLPLQIWAWSGTSPGFVNVTRHYPELAAQDAAGWWRSYTRTPGDREALIAAWAADEENLGRSARVSSTLVGQVRAHRITARFARRLAGFLRHHGYAG